MMKKRDTSVCYFLMVLLMISVVNTLRSSATAVEIAGNSQFSCNGSVGDCMGGSAGSFADDDEYLMESHASSRILLGGSTKSISHPALIKQPFCDATKYGNCIKDANPKTPPRQCTTYARCQRHLSDD